MLLYINKIQKEKVLTSYNFAKSCNLVYAEALTPIQFEKCRNINQRIYYQSDRMIIYKNTEYTVKEGDIIFCHTDFLPNLFSDFKKLAQFSNLILLTNQTDTMIGEKLFKKIPKCFSKWYSINVDLENDKLVSLPLGLSNDYSPKNLKSTDYLEVENDIKAKGVSMYINFRNTNFNERELLYSKFENVDWVTSDIPNIEMSEYLKKLSNHSFVLAPWGNGVDTHRIWETLYAGSIPITKYHPTFSDFRDLPIFFVENYDEITHERLNNFLLSLKADKFYSEKLNIDFWINSMRNLPSDNEFVITIKERKWINYYYDNVRIINNKYHSYMKKIIFQFRKIKKIKRLFSQNS